MLARISVICLLLSGVLPAQDLPFPGQGEARFEGTVESPGEFLGVPLGDRFTPAHEVVDYCRHLAESSDRAQLIRYGQSAEGRPLVVLILSSAENLGALGELQELQKKLADPRLLPENGSAHLQELLERLPAVCWLSYNVHGNESSPTEAALQTAYQLVDGADEVSRRIRESCLVILDPLLNPDGRERYRNWYHSVAAPGGNPDPQAREHAEPWPGGRTNHYYFDLNRDWAWLSQPETRARIGLYLQWQPLVHVDFHEMSPESTYFFFPAEQPINTNLPQHTLEWAKRFGLANAASFDANGWLYYTAESFDLFYPGYGDSWPSFHGAIGMTYEMAGGGRAGLRYLRRDGVILTLRDRLHRHFVTGMATLRCAAESKKELQRSFHEFRRTAIEGGRLGDVVEYLIPPQRAEQRTEMVELLRKQGIEMERTTSAATAEILTDSLGQKREQVALPAGTVVVPLAQPAGRLARALLEPEAEITENRFYDVSAWSLPLASGVRAYASSQRIDVPREPLGDLEESGSVTEPARYAYLLEWTGKSAARALLDLHRRGLRVRLIPEETVIDGRGFGRGTLAVPVRGEDDPAHEAVREVAATHGVAVHGVHRGWTEKGIDLGSEKIRDLAAPEIAVVTGSGVSSSSFGAVWYLLEQELEVSFTSFDLDRLGRVDLDEFNVLVFPNGFDYRRTLTDGVEERLERWVRDGGVLVAISGAALALTQEESGFTAVSSKPPEDEEEKKTPERKKLKDLQEQRRERQVPGSIFRVDLDRDHPLAFGLPQEIFAFMGTTRSFAVSGGGGDVGAFTQDPAVSGFISDENIDKLRNRIYLAEERKGRGKVVLFAGDPNFRLFWRGLTPLFLNALLLRCEK